MKVLKVMITRSTDPGEMITWRAIDLMLVKLARACVKELTDIGEVRKAWLEVADRVHVP